jgi:hypothetical protein
MTSRVARKKKSKMVRVGSRVAFVLGVDEVKGTVIEDRGLLAVGRKRLWRVQLDWKVVAEPVVVEIPESEIRLVG